MAARRKKILVVDDSRSFLTYITVLLKKMGFFKINLAESGMEAIKLMNIWLPDIILLDLIMPGLDGIATLRSIRGNKQTASVPVIMVTSSRDSRKQKECLRHGANQVIFKPITLESLNTAIQECFAATGMNRRKHLRIRFDGLVVLKHEGASTDLQAATLSEGGIFLYTEQPLAVGQMATVCFEADGARHCLDAKVIYHLSDPDSPETGGMALRFTKISPKEAAGIRAYVEGVIQGKQGRPKGHKGSEK